MAIAWISSLIVILDIPYKKLSGNWKKAKLRHVLAGFIFGFSSCLWGLYFWGLYFFV